MISIYEEINKGLNQATGLYCYAEFPQDAFELPLLVVVEQNNRLSNIALDGRVEIADVSYMITIYSENAEDVYTYQAMIDNYFNTEVKRFVGQLSSVQQSYGMYHRTLTYSGTIQRIEDNYYIL